MFEGEPGSAAPQSGLNFVQQQQDAAFVAQSAQPREPAVGRHDDARFALDRLNQNGGGIGRDGGFERREIAKARCAKARHERTKSVTILAFRGEADDRCGAAVKIAFGDDDLRIGDAL